MGIDELLRNEENQIGYVAGIDSEVHNTSSIKALEHEIQHYGQLIRHMMPTYSRRRSSSIRPSAIAAS